jgi:hypothetical protein
LEATGLATVEELRNVEGDQLYDKPVAGVALSWLLPLKQIDAGFADADTVTAGNTLTGIVADTEQVPMVPVTP